jgi:hypothetical protein
MKKTFAIALLAACLWGSEARACYFGGFCGFGGFSYGYQPFSQFVVPSAFSTIQLPTLQFQIQPVLQYRLSYQLSGLNFSNQNFSTQGYQNQPIQQDYSQSYPQQDYSQQNYSLPQQDYPSQGYSQNFSLPSNYSFGYAPFSLFQSYGFSPFFGNVYGFGSFPIYRNRFGFFYGFDTFSRRFFPFDSWRIRGARAQFGRWWNNGGFGRRGFVGGSSFGFGGPSVQVGRRGSVFASAGFGGPSVQVAGGRRGLGRRGFVAAAGPGGAVVVGGGRRR